MKTLNSKPTQRRLSVAACASAVALSTLLVAACRDNQYLDRRDTIRLSAGDAPAHNRAVQTIDPWPAYSKNRNLSADGKRMMVGIKRYQENKSLEPVGANTNEITENEEGPPPPPPAAQ